MDKSDCSKPVVYAPKEYETTVARLIKGDKKRLINICEQLNDLALKRDGILRQGINRCNMSDAIHAAIDCFEKYGMRSDLTLSNFV